MPKVPAGTRYYAVAKGRQPGLYYTWEDCQAQVDGYTGAKHRKLRTSNEAIEWLASNGVQLEEQESPPDSSQPSTTAPPTAADTQSASTSGGRVIAPRLEAMSRIPRAGPSRIANRRVGRSTTPPVQSNVGLPPGIESWVVYCDGACRGNGKTGSIAGVGVYWGEGDQRNIAERCPGVQTNNRAELIAIIRVLETTPKDELPLIIRTDSKYSIRCVTEFLPNWRRNGFRTANGKPVANKALICYIDALLAERKQLGQKVKFEHVYGHRGDVGNEGADRQANLGCELPERSEEEDWESLEEETRLRTAEAKDAMDRADEEMLQEAMSDDKTPMDVDPEPVMSSTPPRTDNLSQTPKKSPFKPAKVDTPQFTSPTSSPVKAAAGASVVAAIALTAEELESYAECLADDDELEAEIAEALA